MDATSGSVRSRERGVNMTLLSVTIAFLVGVYFGILIASLLVASKEAEKREREYWEKREEEKKR